MKIIIEKIKTYDSNGCSQKKSVFLIPSNFFLLLLIVDY